tara:strand:+ start:5092 stop:6468 length:1377 start_codon:yes stop_codon:yes gene_type:complete
MSKPLFDEFDAVSAKQWKQKIQFDLKGDDYNETLIWKSNEDIAVKPFYHSDDFKELPETTNTQATAWNICQSIYVADVKKSNKKALKSIEKGVESFLFIVPSKDISIKDLLQDIDLDTFPVYFELQFLSSEFVEKLYVIPAKAGIHISNDIIGNLTKTGNWFTNLNDDFNTYETIVKTTNACSVNTSLYQNAGANMVQQLAYALAHANEYLDKIDDLEFTNDKKQSLNVTFKISVGTNYFFEIAKLRALSLLYKTIASKYGVNTYCNIMATPTKRNKTLYDHNTNMLRTTTECMSAIIGGANTICNIPFDAIYHKTNAFSERLARNQLLILKHESSFEKVSNPADGSYYIETLTNQLAEKALELFKDIEANGGFLKQLKAGTIQRKIKESAEKEQKQFDAGENILVGSNKHSNPNDSMKNELELYPFVKTNQRKTLIEPIIERRLSETLEKKRLKNED